MMSEIEGLHMGREGKRWRLIGIVLSLLWLIVWLTYEWSSRFAFIGRQMGVCLEEDNCPKVERAV